MRMRNSLLLVLFLIPAVACNDILASDLALIRAKIYPSPTEAPIEDGTILVHNGVITAIGPARRVHPPDFARAVTNINCQGMVVTAGFWNSHVHIFTAGLLHAETHSDIDLSSQLEQMLTRWGFTTVFDTASLLENTNNIRRRIARGGVRGPRIFTVGEPFYAKGGTPIYIRGFLQENRIALPELESPAQGVERVRQEIRDGADGIKIFAGSIEPGSVLIMPLEEARAIVTEAHREGKPVFAHPSNNEGIEIALNSGVDILAHTTPMSGTWTAQQVQRIKAANMALIPTLTLFEVEAKKFGESAEDSANDLRSASQQLKAYSDAKGQILFGTDVGYTDYYDTAEEFRLMSQAGLDFRQILATLTTNPASRFGYTAHSGRVAKDMDADLVVLAGDPAKDVTAFSRVAFTIRQGKIVFGKD
ncbi:MAG: amidohydrolase family protein [Acidobacteria bacterium]|nr:amidohydrolase family protein [Acidobacteriota bacterium]